MADIFTKEKRSEIMGKVKGLNTKPELLVRRFLFSKGLRYRLHQKKLPGTPDIVLKKYRTVIFVNGCFWHGHSNCKSASLPKTQIKFWSDKIERNKKRDESNYNSLRKLGWKILVIYTCDLKVKKLSNTMSKVLSSITD